VGLPDFDFLPWRGRLFYRFSIPGGAGCEKNHAPKNKKPTCQVNLWRWVLGRLL
jgi:hypothetical protein